VYEWFDGNWENIKKVLNSGVMINENFSCSRW
jgi:hypothetical protein